MKSLLYLIIFSFTFHLSIVCADNFNRINLYMDADMTITGKASRLIEMGIRTALSEENYLVSGYKIDLILLDHRGSTARSRKNMEIFLKDKKGLAVFSGSHSPPLITNRKFINENKILVLVPWAAGAPITRAETVENWIFRLSVDDSKTGEVFARRALEQRRFLKPGLVLENTEWGKTNYKNLLKAFEKRGFKNFLVKWVNWGAKSHEIRDILRELHNKGADSVILVTGPVEAALFIKKMKDMGKDYNLPILSHWGITVGSFFSKMNPQELKETDLEFIQTDFSFTVSKYNSQVKSVSESVLRQFKSVKKPEDINPATGFVHGYDLTKILISALKQSGKKKDIIELRKSVKDNLENLEKPVDGLLKTYIKPFEAYSLTNPDAHEALGVEDIVFGRFDNSGRIYLNENRE